MSNTSAAPSIAATVVAALVGVASSVTLETKYKIAELLRVVGANTEFAFGDKFKYLLVTWQNQVVRTYIFNAIAFATTAEVEAIGEAGRQRLLAVLLWDMKRLNGTWRNKAGELKQLYFADSFEHPEDKSARGEYYKRLNMAIVNLKRGGR